MCVAAAIAAAPDAASAQPVTAPVMTMGPNPTVWTTPGGPPGRTDPLVVTAATELAVGGAFALGGAIAVGVASGSRHVCGAIAGCFDTVHPELDPLRGGAFSVGFGLGLAASGGVSLIASAVRPLEPGETRELPVVATIGHAAIGLSVGFFAAGFSYGSVARSGGREAYDEGWPAFVASGVLMIAGMPMLAFGAPISSAEERGRRRARQGHASIGPMNLAVGAGSALATWSWF